MELATMDSALGLMRESDSREKKDRLQSELAKLPQYEPATKHTFHGGMYFREVWRDAGVLVVGGVHKKEHMYMIISGTVSIDGAAEITGPAMMMCKPGTKRAVLSLTPVLCMTVHRTDAKTVEEAEIELMEYDETSSYNPGNKVKPEVIAREKREVLT